MRTSLVLQRLANKGQEDALLLQISPPAKTSVQRVMHVQDLSWMNQQEITSLSFTCLQVLRLNVS